MDLELTKLLADNATFSRDRKPGPTRQEPARRLAIVTCMDVRLDLAGALGLDVGDAHIIRNAGGRVTPDVVRSLVISTRLLAAREIGVIHHTDCGLEGLRDEDGAQRTGVERLPFLGFDDLDQSVCDDVDALRTGPELPDAVVVWGAVYDTMTAALRVVVEPR